MVVKVYISGISGNKEVKKRQQRVLLILDSKNVKYEVIDIAEPGSEDQKEYMQNNSTSNGATISDPNPRHPLPPQIFNDDVYCGDYDQFDMANEVDEMEKFLKLEPLSSVISNAEIKLGNGEIHSDDIEASQENEISKEETVSRNDTAVEKQAGDQKLENGDEENKDENPKEESTDNVDESPEKADDE